MINFHDVLWTLFVLFVVTSGDILTSVQWSPQNEMFLPNKTCNRISVLPMDQLHFICPHTGTYLRHFKDPLPWALRYQNMYMLNDQEHFRTCNASAGKLLLTCDKPKTIKFTGVVFSRYSASDNDPLFIPGHTYFFINTASGSETTLANKIGGSCASDNMKLEIYVCYNTSDPRCSKRRGPLDCHEFEETKEKQDCATENPTVIVTDVKTTITDPETEEGDTEARACTASSLLQFKMIEFVGYLLASFFLGFLFALLFCWTCCKSQPRKRGKCYARMCWICSMKNNKDGNHNVYGTSGRSYKTTTVWYMSSV